MSDDESVDLARVTTARLDDHDLVVLEVSFHKQDEAPYFAGHIPGSRFAYWKDLLWHELDRQFPSSTVMANRLGSLGVGESTALVLEGDPVQFATYAYWVLAMTGFEARCRVLDGGRATWASRKYPMTKNLPLVEPRSVTPAGSAETNSWQISMIRTASSLIFGLARSSLGSEWRLPQRRSITAPSGAVTFPVPVICPWTVS